MKRETPKSFRKRARAFFSRGRGEYIGDAMPSWVKPGVRLRVKSTVITRKYGLGSGSRDRAWPGEIGVIRVSQGANESAGAFWMWEIQFARVRFHLDHRLLENLARVKAP